MSITKKIFVLISFLLLAVLSSFIFRNALLHYAIERTRHMVKKRYGLNLDIADAGFHGIRNIYVRKLSLVPPGKDTLMYIGNADVRVSISKILRLKIAFNEVYADSVRINVVKYDSLNTNYSSLIPVRRDSTVRKKEVTGFDDLLNAVLGKVNNLFNENVVFYSVKINYTADGFTEQLNVPELLYDRKTIKASVVTASVYGVAAYKVSGTADADNTSYSFHVIRTNDEKAPLPFIDRLDGFKVSFDTLAATLQADENKRIIPLKASLKFKNLTLNHWRISPVDVLFGDLEIDLNSLTGNHRFTVDNGTEVRMLELPLSFNGYYERMPRRRLIMNAHFDCTAGKFFSSLPPGMFNTLQGFDATGNLKFNMHAALDFEYPDSVQFTSSLKKENFRIKRFGEEYFPIINNDFQFTAMDRDVPVRKIIVGQDNPMFAAYGEISDYLKMAVLTSEDPSFMTHQGFVEESFRESIAKNLKEGRFARGGSTISMQLVKNLFLSRNKTISRKLEEALIVWIIEQNRLVSKERMLEVYLNIIEWGPDVYGIGEASRFYFSKLPSELNLSESVFLASIIPHPKYFKYMFDSTGTLKEKQKGYYTLITSRLLNRNQITQGEFDSLAAPVRLKGEALNLVVPVDTIPAEEIREE